MGGSLADCGRWSWDEMKEDEKRLRNSVTRSLFIALSPLSYRQTLGLSLAQGKLARIMLLADLCYKLVVRAVRDACVRTRVLER